MKKFSGILFLLASAACGTIPNAQAADNDASGEALAAQNMAGNIYTDSSIQGNSAAVLCVPADNTDTYTTKSLRACGGYSTLYVVSSGTYKVDVTVPVKIMSRDNGSELLLQIYANGQAVTTVKLNPSAVGTYSVSASATVNLNANASVEMLVVNTGTNTTWSVPTASGTFSIVKQ